MSILNTLNGKIIYKWWFSHCHVWLPEGKCWYWLHQHPTPDACCNPRPCSLFCDRRWCTVSTTPFAWWAGRNWRLESPSKESLWFLPLRFSTTSAWPSWFDGCFVAAPLLFPSGSTANPSPTACTSTSHSWHVYMIIYILYIIYNLLNIYIYNILNISYIIYNILYIIYYISYI